LSEVRRAAAKRIQEEKGSVAVHRGEDFAVVFPTDLKTPDERLHYAAEQFTQLRDRAKAFLNPAQLAAYQEQLKKALREMHRAWVATPAPR
jgi:hypothetical protein